MPGLIRPDMAIKKSATKPTESRFIAQLADELKIPKTEAKKVLAAQEKVIEQNLKRHGIAKTPLGAFKAKHVPAKKGGKKLFMPALGRTVITKNKPASTKVRFVAKRTFRDRL